MQCQSRARAGNRMHLCGVAEFFLNGCSGSRLNELSKARPGVSKSPRRKLDSKSVESFPNDFDRFIVHGKVSIPLPETLKKVSSLITATTIRPNQVTCPDLLGPS